MSFQAFGIDVSKHQGLIDWTQVKNNIDFAILRVGYGNNIESQDDKYFLHNANECARLGIPFGAYIYSYARSESDAKSEAAHMLRMINGLKLAYPVWYDLEDAKTTGRCTNAQIAEFAKIFCSTVESAGYFVGVYANKNWFENKLTDRTVFDRYAKWVAQYAAGCTYRGTYGIWQFTSSGTMAGIQGNVDKNFCFVDYPQMIKSAGLNGYKRSDYYGSWAEKEIDEVIAKKIMSVDEEGNFRPNDVVTRAQAAKIICNVLEYIKKENV